MKMSTARAQAVYTYGVHRMHLYEKSGARVFSYVLSCVRSSVVGVYTVYAWYATYSFTLNTIELFFCISQMRFTRSYLSFHI